VFYSKFARERVKLAAPMERLANAGISTTVRYSGSIVGEFKHVLALFRAAEPYSRYSHTNNSILWKFGLRGYFAQFRAAANDLRIKEENKYNLSGEKSEDSEAR
jgi:hypothetical protein